MGKLGVREKSQIHILTKPTPVPGFGTSFLPFVIAEESDDRGDAFPPASNFGGGSSSTTITNISNVYAFPAAENDDGEQGVPGGVGNFGGSTGGGTTTNNYVTNNYIAQAQEPDDPEVSVPGGVGNFGGVLPSALAQIPNGTILGNFSGALAVPTASTPDADLIQRTYFATSTSGTGTYTATLTPVPTAYVNGAQYVFAVTSSNPANAPTINFNSLGALNIKFNGAAAVANSLIPGVWYQGVRNGSDLNIVGSSGTTYVYPTATSLLYGWRDSDDFVATTPYPTNTAGFNARTFSSKTTYDPATAGTPSVSIALEKGHPGVIAVSVATGTLEFEFCGSGTTVGVGTLQLDQGGGSDLVMYFKTAATLSAPGAVYIINGGWKAGATDNFLWRYTDGTNAGAFTLNTTTNSVTTTTNGITTLLASTWYRMRININAAYTVVTLYTTVGTVSAGVTTWGAEFQEAQFSGTMPRNTVAYYGSFLLNRSSGATTAFSMDGWEYAINLAAPRGG